MTTDQRLCVTCKHHVGNAAHHIMGEIFGKYDHGCALTKKTHPVDGRKVYTRCAELREEHDRYGIRTECGPDGKKWEPAYAAVAEKDDIEAQRAGIVEGWTAWCALQRAAGEAHRERCRKENGNA